MLPVCDNSAKNVRFFGTQAASGAAAGAGSPDAGGAAAAVAAPPTSGSSAATARAKALAATAARATSTPAWMSEMMELEEETGLTCMVCHEGYKCKVCTQQLSG